MTINFIYAVLSYCLSFVIAQLLAYFEDKRYLIDKQCIPEVVCIIGISLLTLFFSFMPISTLSELLAIAAIMGCFSVSAIVDAKTMELPDNCTLFLFVMIVIFGITSYVHPADYTYHLISVISYVLAMLLIDWKFGGSIGRGDFKLLLPVVMLIGIVKFLWLILFACIISVIIGVIKVSVLLKQGIYADYKNTSVALGPSLYLAFIIVLLNF